MLTIAISDPSKYELLIEAITIAMINNHEKATEYEQLIAELNSNITSTIAVPTVGNRLYRPGSESTGVLPPSQGGANSI